MTCMDSRIRGGLSLFLIVLFLGLTGCQQETTELSNSSGESLLDRAKSKELENDQEAARDLLKSALDLDPRLAAAHLDLALILDDYERKYVEAIYHYQRYLELRPETEKMDMIMNRVRQARIAYAGTMSKPVAETPEFIEKLREENNALKATLDNLKAQLAKVEMQRDAARAQLVAAVPDRPDDLETATGTKYYMVRRRDTLQTIANQFYGDKEKWRVIYNANRETLRNPNALQIGQKLRIPASD